MLENVGIDENVDIDVLMRNPVIKDLECICLAISNKPANKKLRPETS